MSPSFERISAETRFSGKMITLQVARFRYDDGDVVEREIAVHPGAAAAVVVDGDELVLVRQPREAIGTGASLELPAGKLDPGEDPLTAMQRELGEETGLQASDWEPLGAHYTSPGFTDERIHIFLATGVSEDPDAEPVAGERIEIVRRPLTDLDALIGEVQDGKSLIGLLLYSRRLSGTVTARE